MKNITKIIFSFAKQFPNFYLTLFSILAVCGYIYLLAPPILAIVGIFKIAQIIPNLSDLKHAAELSMWALLTIGAIFVSKQLITLKFPITNGIRLPRHKAERLFNLLDNTNTAYPWPIIDNIHISKSYELILTKTPVFGVPLYTSNNLIIGLPLFLTLSPQQFESALTRIVIQYSKKINPITNWLRQLIEIWELYLSAYKICARNGDQYYYWFFLLYAPTYKFFGGPVKYMDELNADNSALDLVNSDDLINSIQAMTVNKFYLDSQYWPNIKKIQVQNKSKPISPYSKLFSVTQSAISQHDTKHWMENLSVSLSEDTPSFIHRMENLGRTKVKELKPTQTNAAQKYLQDCYQQVVKMLDNKWLNSISNTNKAKLCGSVVNIKGKKPGSKSKPVHSMDLQGQGKPKSTHKPPHKPPHKPTQLSNIPIDNVTRKPELDKILPTDYLDSNALFK